MNRSDSVKVGDLFTGRVSRTLLHGIPSLILAKVLCSRNERDWGTFLTKQVASSDSLGSKFCSWAHSFRLMCGNFALKNLEVSHMHVSVQTFVVSAFTKGVLNHRDHAYKVNPALTKERTSISNKNWQTTKMKWTSGLYYKTEQRTRTAEILNCVLEMHILRLTVSNMETSVEVSGSVDKMKSEFGSRN